MAIIIGTNFLSVSSDYGRFITESHPSGLDFGFRNSSGQFRSRHWAQPHGTPLVSTGLPAGVAELTDRFTGCADEWGTYYSSRRPPALSPQRLREHWTLARDFPAVQVDHWSRQQSQQIVLDGMFRDLTGIGVKVIRWPLLGMGAALGDPFPMWDPVSRRWECSGVPAAQTWFRDARGRSVPNRSSPFLADVYHALCSARRVGISVLLVMFDFGAFENSVVTTNSQGRRVIKVSAPPLNGQPQQTFSDGNNRYDLLSSDYRIEQLLQGWLKPVLDMTRDFWDVVAGVELINEPDWVTSNAPQWREPVNESAGRYRRRFVEWERMQYFLKRGVEMINEWARQANEFIFDSPQDVVVRDMLGTLITPNRYRFSTIGFANLSCVLNWHAIQGSTGNAQNFFHVMKVQFHQYGSAAGPMDLPYRFCYNLMLGEIGTRRNCPCNLLDSTFAGAGGRGNYFESKSIAERIGFCASRGYGEIFFWQYSQIPADRYGNSRTEWTDLTKSEISQYHTSYAADFERLRLNWTGNKTVSEIESHITGAFVV